MKRIIKKIWEWLNASNRIKHLGCGYVVGFGANDWYCCEYTIIGVASALEYKDYAHGCKWDWIDWALTIVGGNLGYLTRFLLFR